MAVTSMLHRGQHCAPTVVWLHRHAVVVALVAQTWKLDVGAHHQRNYICFCYMHHSMHIPSLDFSIYVYIYIWLEFCLMIGSKLCKVSWIHQCNPLVSLVLFHLSVFWHKIYPMKYAQFCCGFLCIHYDLQLNSCHSFTHILQSCFTGTGAIIRLPQCQWSNPAGYG